jgi:hypothetical protein
MVESQTKRIGLFLLLAFVFFVCCQNTLAKGGTELNPRYRHYSDYFVFISRSPDDPLIVPLDINWEWMGGNRVFREVKTWWGTEGDWIYDALVEPARIRAFPETWQQVPGGRGFSWSPGQWRVAVENGAGRFTLIMDPFEERGAVETSGSGGFKVLNLAEGRIEKADRTIEGYVIHEQIRSATERKTGTREPFGRFTWIPLVTADRVFLFTTRGENQSLIRWVREGRGFTADDGFTYEYIETRLEAETESGRGDVPVAWRITVPELKLTFDFEGKGHHTGYGEPTDGQKPLYREQLAQGRARLPDSGRSFETHGMIELILED